MDDFDKLIKDENIIKITKKASEKFHRLLDKEEIYTCILNATWKAYIKYNPQKGSKFTTYLYKGVIIECLTQIKFNKHKRTYVELHENYSTNDINYTDLIDEILAKCDDPGLILDKFFHNKTIKEIAAEHKICNETARLKIKKNLKKLQKYFN